MAKVEYVCTICGEPVLKDAWASWNPTQQRWELEEVFDQAFCPNCDGETSVEVKPIE